jgi:hypothetical protein
MNTSDKILTILEAAARSVAELEFRSEPASFSLDTVLVGDEALLDSMGFINFIVAVEDSIAQDFNLSINLSEELDKAYADRQSALTLGDLNSFLCDLVQGRTTVR